MYLLKSLSSKAGKACFEHGMLCDGDRMPMVGSFNEENRKNVCLSFFD